MNKRIKKTAIGLLASTALLLPIVSLANTEPLKAATDKILAIVDGDSSRLNTVGEAIDAYMMKYENNTNIYDILGDLKNMLFDTFFMVDDFLMCESYYDGCNTCVVGESGWLACTKMACLVKEEPYCMQYEGEEPEGQDPMTEAELGCSEAGGSFSPLYNECEGISSSTCEELGGKFYECGSACRHELEPVACTLQCVQYCEFDTIDDQEIIDTQMELDAAMSRRDAQEITDYDIIQKHTCFCPVEYTRPIFYSVVDAEVDIDSAYYDDGEQEAIDPDMSPTLLTVEDAFALIQDAIDQNAAMIDVTYDETLGYPTNIAIDYSEMMADEEKYYTFKIEL